MNECRNACSTKAKRQALASQIIELGKRYGAEIVPEEFPDLLGPYATHLALRLGPYRLSMEFDGHSNVGAFLGHWHMSLADDDKAAIYPAEFPADVNQYHHRKATTCEGTFPEFVAAIERGLKALASQ